MTNGKSFINKSLREQVYTYFCDLMKKGELTSGRYINQAEICNELDISKAPLRDALIQLETEGFVSILPRRGVIINSLSLEDVVNAYQILGGLESVALEQAFDRLESSHLEEMERINAELFHRLQKGLFDEYYALNNELHNIFLDLADNVFLKRIVTPLKQRLYDFPLRPYIVEWEEENLREHDRLIVSIRKRNIRAAMDILRYEHWNAQLHKKGIKAFYKF
ncbi:DNA-binding transcriptional regulator, GntR family [Desulfocicer vacuolatum DSM 3385]|uniref:DNA-binding transcriptional regulator, GntR family n=1 Tax=Desulfocicer vacuolatum DSM 3385 TaxID=1121400 RepID=A0A1W2EIR3_9BACT|nr:GntR family transcriptional regulator [Desulfocicer vacuolatum]SMD09584.1 DNA-binding transcriptional regulator, GntR family [Desulfocicer vacuolatum DSM 3385]